MRLTPLPFSSHATQIVLGRGTLDRRQGANGTPPGPGIGSGIGSGPGRPWRGQKAWHRIGVFLPRAPLTPRSLRVGPITNISRSRLNLSFIYLSTHATLSAIFLERSGIN